MKSPRIRRDVLYPLGYPLQIESESPDVLGICREAWAHWPRLFESPPLRLRIWVRSGKAGTRPRFVVQRGTAAYIADPHNCGGFRVGTGDAWLRISERTVRNRVAFRYHFLEALALTLLDTVAFTPIHAACIARANRSVLLCGESGAGKSSLAYLAAARGWSFISDDAVHVARDGSGSLIGNPYKLHLRAGADTVFPELSGRLPRQLPNGKSAIEIATAQLHREVRCGPARACVFLRRRPGQTHIRAHPTNSAFAYFRKYAWWLPEAQSMSAFRSVVEGGCWSLEYESGEAALAALTRLLDRGAP